MHVTDGFAVPVADSEQLLRDTVKTLSHPMPPDFLKADVICTYISANRWSAIRTYKSVNT